MKRYMRLVIAIIGVQILLAAIYWFVEQNRAADAFADLDKGVPQRMDAVLPGLVVQRLDGNRVVLQTPKRPTLVHFWATWCPPCLMELPSLLALPDQYPIDVVAISLNTSWGDVKKVVDDRLLFRVVLGDASEVERSLGVVELPVTFFVAPGGRIQWRIDGARDWTDRSLEVFGWKRQVITHE